MVEERGWQNFKTWKMSGCIRQRLGPTRKQLKVRIEQTQTFLQQVTLGESESNANELLLKLDRNLKSYKELLEQLQETSKLTTKQKRSD